MFNPVARTVYMMMRSHGGDMVLVEQRAGEYDVETSTVVSKDARYDVRGMIFDYIPRNFGTVTAGQSLVQTGDKQVLIRPDEDLPQITPRDFSVIVNNIVYNVIGVKEVNPSGTNILLYDLHVRA